MYRALPGWQTPWNSEGLVHGMLKKKPGRRSVNNPLQDVWQDRFVILRHREPNFLYFTSREAFNEKEEPCKGGPISLAGYEVRGPCIHCLCLQSSTFHWLPHPCLGLLTAARCSWIQVNMQPPMMHS